MELVMDPRMPFDYLPEFEPNADRRPAYSPVPQPASRPWLLGPNSYMNQMSPARAIPFASDAVSGLARMLGGGGYRQGVDDIRREKDAFAAAAPGLAQVRDMVGAAALGGKSRVRPTVTPNPEAIVTPYYSNSRALVPVGRNPVGPYTGSAPTSGVVLPGRAISSAILATAGLLGYPRVGGLEAEKAAAKPASRGYVGPEFDMLQGTAMPTMQPLAAAAPQQDTIRVIRGGQGIRDYGRDATGGYVPLPTPGERQQAMLDRAKATPKPPTLRDQMYGLYGLGAQKEFNDAMRADPKNAARHHDRYLKALQAALAPQGIAPTAIFNRNDDDGT